MDEWEKMTGAELAHILALEGQAAALQAALDAKRTDWAEAARELLASLQADPQHVLFDESTGTAVPTTRIDVLTDELRRACLEEG